MAGALDGLMVLDLTTHLSGPFCGMQLGDLGADVIKIESPQGDSMRGAPPFIEGEGAPFMLWNRNKRGIRLDLKDPADLEVFWDLVDDADVVLENFRPGVMKRLGLGWDALHARNPRLVLRLATSFCRTPTISSLFLTRSALVLKRGSSASSGCPIMAQSLRKKFCWAPPMVSQPSAVWNTW